MTSPQASPGGAPDRGGGGLLERPLTPRSLILSLLLGRHPPRARVGLLVRWCALFGVSDNAARVALSRMVERGELEMSDATYGLGRRLRSRQRDQDLALAPPEVLWSGQWHVVILGSVPRAAAQRQRARAALAAARFAQRREGVWVRPDNLALPARDAIGVDADCWSAMPECDGADLAARLFALDAAGARGRRLLEELRRCTDVVDPEAPASLAAAFVAGAAVLQHLRRDPLLPPVLAPADWPGDALREEYMRFREAFAGALADWYRAAGELRN